MRIIHNKKMISGIPWLACSGGVDSIAVAHYLYLQRIEFRILHIHHGYQDINDKMCDAVVNFAQDYGIEEYTIHLQSFKKIPGESDESVMHKCRIKAYNQLSESIITCHHLDDCVESYLMNCFNGVGEYLPIPVETKLDNGYKIIRPFIMNSKADFIKHVNHYHFLKKYIVEDPTNNDTSFRRNWIRNSIIPQCTDKGIGFKSLIRKRYLDVENSRNNQPV